MQYFVDVPDKGRADQRGPVVVGTPAKGVRVVEPEPGRLAAVAIRADLRLRLLGECFVFQYKTTSE